MATSTFIRQAILEKINHKNGFDKVGDILILITILPSYSNNLVF